MFTKIKFVAGIVIEAPIFTGVGQGQTVFISRNPLIPSDNHFQFKRLEFSNKTDRLKFAVQTSAK